MRHALTTLALAALFWSAPLEAQKASQTGRVTQFIADSVEVTVQWDRPSARGRELYGDLVVWDGLWTPGANRATWIEFSAPVVFEGVELPAGRYGLWLTIREREPWIVTLVDDWDTHHSFFPFDTEAAVVEIRPEEAPHMETLLFYFRGFGADGTELALHWGDRLIPMRIRIGD